MAPSNYQTLLNDHRPIQFLRVVAQTTGNTGKNTSENHWSIFAVTSSTASVRANMNTPVYGDVTGRLDWETHNYILTNSALDHWDYQAAQGFKISDLVAVVHEHGRDQYDFSGGGSGCRWWCYTVMCDLAQWGYVHGQVPQSLYPHMEFQYHKTLPKKPLQNFPRGEFYPREIPQPVVYQSTSNKLPAGNYIKVTVRGKSAWTRLEAWTSYYDHNNRQCISHGTYNQFYYFTAPYQTTPY
ncbi:hypothetical protein FQN54_001742 [Arachnomyces sp. PD_36]|nr:hypothetical protein FQN54_001742 [Arachnomyces sp. PD_36]